MTDHWFMGGQARYFAPDGIRVQVSGIVSELAR